MRKAAIAICLTALAALAGPAASEAAPAGAAWAISTQVFSPTSFTPGTSSGEEVYVVVATDVGSEPTDGSAITLTDTLPAGLTYNPSGAHVKAKLEGEAGSAGSCAAGPPVSCTVAAGKVLYPGDALRAFIPVNVEAGAPPSVRNRVAVSGGGATGASDSVQTAVSAEPAPFGFQSFTAALDDGGGGAATQAGSHPFALRVGSQLNTIRFGSSSPASGSPHDISVDLPKGLVLNPSATPVRCTEVQLESGDENGCPDGSAVGVVYVTIGQVGFPGMGIGYPLYNMVPPAGRPAELAFNVGGLGFFIHLEGRVRSDGDYGLSSDTYDIPQYGSLQGIAATLWGDPSDPSHDHQRGHCHGSNRVFNGGITCPVSRDPAPFITMPSACQGPLQFTAAVDSWQEFGAFVHAAAQSEDLNGNPVGVTGCEKLSYDPSTESTPSTEQAETGSGFDYKVDFPTNGLGDANAIAESTTEKAEVTLPEGVTINPSVGEGLGYCTPSQYARETAFSAEGEGCPIDSKIGTLHLHTPLLEEGIDGSVYLAQQDNPETTEHGAENPFDTDIALYLVMQSKKLGVIVKQPLKVVPDPKTGQLVATLEEIPSVPFDHFTFHFREGARAALITPARCGTYTTVGKFYPYSDPTQPKIVESQFKITKGVDGGPCPSGDVPPFHPEFEAGAVNNSAGAFSPFDMRLIRHDGEQDMTKFSSVLPPGELGSLAGVSKCPDSAIAAAKGKTGRQEEAHPSCPANSLIGHTIAGAGVGDALTYVPGEVYLGGPYHGDPLSVISITPGVAGPYDAGTIVVQLALTLNPKTAEVEVDGAASDPIPHILKGIVLKVRDLRVHVDRPNFTLNPTNCSEEQVRGTIFGSNLNVLSPADDQPFGLHARYQAADCQALGFKPALRLKLKGGTRRGGHPGLRAIYTPRNGDANIKGLVVRLPRSAFLDQAHIKTICTRVQFAAGGGNGEDCPARSRYGYVRAWTPLLDEPLEGPVFLRSSNHKLPDMVLALHGLVNVEVGIRIDSSHGGIRATMEDAPDAHLSRVLLRMQGARKGLIVNSRNLCAHKSRANVLASGQNGKRSHTHPVMRAQCGKAHKKKHKRHHKRARVAAPAR